MNYQRFPIIKFFQKIKMIRAMIKKILWKEVKILKIKLGLK